MPPFASGPVPALALSPCGTRVAAAAAHDHISLLTLPASPSAPLTSLALPPAPALFPVPSVTALCFPASSAVYTADARGSFKRLAASDGLSEQYTVAAAHSGDELTAIAALSDFSPIATSGKDGAVRLWDPETRQSIARLTGHRYEVRDVAIASSSDSAGAAVTVVASAGRDKTVRLWDVRASSAKEVHCLRGHAGWVHAVALGNAPGGPIALSCGGDKTVRVWDLTAMKERMVMRGHEYRVWGLALASDAAFAITGSTDATVRAWNLGEGEGAGDCHVYEGHADSVLSVDVARNGVFAVSGCEDGALFMWDCATLFGRDAKKEVHTETLIDVEPVSKLVEKEAITKSVLAPKQLDTEPLIVEQQMPEEKLPVLREAKIASPSRISTTPAFTASPRSAPITSVSDAIPDTGMTTDGLKAAASVTVDQEPKFDKSAAELVNALRRIKDLETALADSKEQLESRNREIASLKKSTLEKDNELSVLQRQIDSSKNLINAANVRALLAANPRKVDESLDYEEPVNKIGAVSDKLSALVARLDAMVATH